ncbi:MAG TPA: DUF2911 domain-containing protein [Gemmatimonadales bacterium]|nr:DUF2911 domain-containing protein [Gemmatimonadales bacterium]
MRIIAVPLALLGLAASIPLAAQNAQGAFVVTLGADTIVAEQYKRTGTTVEGDMLVRGTALIQRHYTGTLNANGTMAHFEMTNKNVSNPQAPVTRFVAQFGDTTQVDVTRDTTHTTFKVPTPGGALPFINFSYDMYELYGRRAALSKRDTVATLPLGATSVTNLIARHPAKDSLTVAFEGDAPTLFAVNAAGQIQRVDGRLTTQKVHSARQAAVDLARLATTFAGRPPLGQLSPPDSVKGSVGGAALLVEYGRPSMRGRVIFGAEGGSPRPVVPYGQVWRTGANFATRFTTSGDLSVGGQTIPAGTYTLWTLPQAAGWKLIFNKQTKAPCANAAECADPKRANLWGTDYSADSDFVRVDMQVAATAQPVDRFVITLEPQGETAILALAWEKTRVFVNLAKK